jgi:hypothetical protein
VQQEPSEVLVRITQGEGVGERAAGSKRGGGREQHVVNSLRKNVRGLQVRKQSTRAG